MAIFNVDASEVVAVTNRLERIGKKEMPIAVRNTLNETAYQMKSKHIGREFRDNFTIRRDRFIDVHTRFTRCENTLSLSSMVSEAGVMKGKSISGDRLEKQESGGTIPNRAVPTDDTRKGGRNEATQDAKYYFRKFNKLPKGIVLKNRNRTIIKTENRLFEISKGSIYRTLYTLNSTARIKPKRFIEHAGNKAVRLMNDIYFEQLQKRLNK